MVEQQSNNTSYLADFKRRTDERRDCNISTRIISSRGDIACRIVNLSAGGASITLNGLLLTIGEKVRFSEGRLAGITGVIRWASSPRYGLQFDQVFAANGAVRATLQDLPRHANSEASSTQVEPANLA